GLALAPQPARPESGGPDGPIKIPAALPERILACSSISALACDQRSWASRRTIRSRAGSASSSIRARGAGPSPPASTRQASELQPAGEVTFAGAAESEKAGYRKARYCC